VMTRAGATPLMLSPLVPHAGEARRSRRKTALRPPAACLSLALVTRSRGG
jgi:hypothetical protein